MKAGGGTSSDSSWALSRENPCFPIMNMRIQHNMYKLEVKRSSLKVGGALGLFEFGLRRIFCPFCIVLLEAY